MMERGQKLAVPRKLFGVGIVNGVNGVIDGVKINFMVAFGTRKI